MFLVVWIQFYREEVQNEKSSAVTVCSFHLKHHSPWILFNAFQFHIENLQLMCLSPVNIH